MNPVDDQPRHRPLFDAPDRAGSRSVDYDDSLFEHRAGRRQGRAVEYYPAPERPRPDRPLLMLGVGLIVVALAALGLREWVASSASDTGDDTNDVAPAEVEDQTEVTG